VFAAGPLFIAPRVIVARPIWARDIYEYGGPVEILAIPVAYRRAMSPAWAWIAEVAPMAGLQTSRTGSAASRLTTDAHVGGYAAIALEYRP
jgi:hypothetical protein